jgi:twinkle protein
MAQCLAKLPHSCGSSDGLQAFLSDEGNITGYCFSCSTFVSDPYGDTKPDLKQIKVKSRKEVEDEILEIKECGYVGLYRGIPAEYWKKHGVRASINQTTGKGMNAIHHPKTKDGVLVGYMNKLVSKKAMWLTTIEKEYDLSSWEVAKRTGSRTLYVTEGEEDCLAVDYILTSGDTGQYVGQKHAVTSLPNGTKSVSVLGRMAGEIRARFDEVVLVFDDDASGKAAVSEALKFFPSANVVTLPAKDANDCVKLGLMKEAYAALKFRKVKVAPSGLVTFGDVADTLYEVAKMGQSTPWSLVDQWIRGQHKSRLYTICGGEGSGKSSLIHTLAAHNLVHHKEGVLFVQLEETPEESFINIGSRIIARDLSDPKNPISEQEKSQLMEIYNDKLFVFDVTNDRSNSPEELVDNIFQLAREVLGDYGYLYLDNLTKMSEGLDSSARNDFIADFAAKADTFARRNEVSVWVLSHLNKQPKTETPYSEGGRISLNGLAGGTGLQRYSSGIFGFERNGQGINSDVSKLRVLKNRVGRQTGTIKMAYDPMTTRIIEADWDDNDFKTKK